jgi:tetratricopeptide (TPR) repeat protein
MSSEQWSSLKRLFAAACELPSGERAALMDRECPAPLRDELEALLAANDRENGVLDGLQPPPGIVSRAAALHAFQPGETVAGRYRIDSMIGEGGMGEVYAAQDLELGERLALKTLRAGALGEAGMDGFRREVQLARKVTHPHVCRIFDFGKHGDAMFLTMELVEGETLAARLKRDGAMSATEALEVARQIASALDAAHAAGVAHRDFKPGNILVGRGADGAMRAVVTDFGLARPLASGGEGVSSAGLAIGTPAYMAPEQIEGKGAGPPADIYALGVVLYEMVTGELPYDARSPLAMAAEKVRRLPAPPSARGAAGGVWDAVILRCLAFDPAERFGSAKEAVRALESGRVPRNWRRRATRAAATIAGAALLTLAAAGAIRYWPRANPEVALRLAEGEGAMADGAMLRARGILQRGLELDPGNPILHARLAECLWDLDAIDRAKDEILHATGSGGGDLYVQAIRHTALRDFGRAEETMERRARGSSGTARPRTLLDLARAQERNERAAEAAATYREILAGDAHNGSALLQLGRLAGRSAENAKALEWLRRAAAAFQAVGNYEGAATVSYERGVLLRNQGKSAEAERELKEALESARVTGHSQLQIRSSFQLAALAADAGESERAGALAQGAWELAERAGSEHLAAQGWIELGNLHLRRARWSEAERCFSTALDQARRSRARATEARALLSLASVAERTARFEETRQRAAEAMVFYRQGGYRRTLGQALMLEARAAVSLADYDAAETLWNQALASASTAQELPLMAVCEEGLGTVRARRGRLTAARENYEHAAALYQKAGQTPNRLLSLLNLAELAWMLGDGAGAEGLLREVEAGRAGAPPNVLLRMALVRMQSAIARRDSSAASEVGTALKIGETVGGLGWCRAQAHAAEAESLAGRMARARQLRDRSLECARAKITGDIFTEYLLAAAETSALTGDDRGARQFAAQAYDAASKLGQREEAWHAALILGPSQIHEAAALATELKTQWGEAAWKSYSSRPDLRPRFQLLERKTP